MRLLALSALLLAASLPAAEVPPALKAALDRPDSITLYSLEPTRDKDKARPKEVFHGVAVLGKTEVKGDARKDLAAALVKAIEDKAAKGARCFIPRHGVSVKSGDKTIDLVICFECSWVDVYEGDTSKRQTIGTDGGLLNRILTGAKVTLPKGPPKGD